MKKVRQKHPDQPGMIVITESMLKICIRSKLNRIQ